MVNMRTPTGEKLYICGDFQKHIRIQTGEGRTSAQFVKNWLVGLGDAAEINITLYDHFIIIIFH